MNWLKWILAILLTLLLATSALIYSLLYLSLPAYEGELKADVTHSVRLDRDNLGYLSIHAANRHDVAYALGFSHAQERFFQMDLLRRNAAGELAELFGKRALPADKTLRQHRFRYRAQRAFNALGPAEQQLVKRYREGVNQGLALLSVRPFEYLLLKQSPMPWQDEDAFLVIYSMYLDLQSKLGRDDYAMTVLKQALPADWYAFLQQHSDVWQAALDDSVMPSIPMPDSSYPAILKASTLACNDCTVHDAADIGSNNFAVAGSLTSHGGAMLADDMHLGIRVPGTWFKAQLNWRNNGELHQVTGLTLPGTPAMVVGSNGKIAWGFTNSTADWHDLVTLTMSEDGKQYLTPEGWQQVQYHYETIDVAGGEDETVQLAETQWGPIVRFGDSPAFALRWTGYDVQAVNLKLIQLEQATSTQQAIQLAPQLGIPVQNLVVADKDGDIGWSLAGPVPQRQLADLDTAQDWSSGENSWRGYADASSQPNLTDVARLWTANARMIGKDDYQLIGNGGYDLGARGWQIRQGLNELQQVNEQSLHAIQLDNRALMLSRWRELLLTRLDDATVQQHNLQAYRQHLVNSAQRASIDDVGYSLVREFRTTMLERQFAPLSAYLELHGAQSRYLKYSLETPLWQMLQQRRADTLGSAEQDWDTAILEAILLSKQHLEQQYGRLAEARWGNQNQANFVHPLSAALPIGADWLNMPATALHGDSHMPRVQRPGFGQSQRMVVAPGHEENGILTIPTGQSGHPLSPFYRADHNYWLNEVALPFLPGAKKYQLVLTPQG